MDMIRKYNSLERKIRESRYNCYDLSRDDLLFVDEANTSPEAINNDKATQTETDTENAPKGKRKLCSKCSKIIDEKTLAEKSAIQRATHVAHFQRMSLVNVVTLMDW